MDLTWLYYVVPAVIIVAGLIFAAHREGKPQKLKEPVQPYREFWD